MRKILLLSFLLAASAQAGTTLDAVRKTHALSCGAMTAVNDETKDDTHGDTSAFGADVCRAVAAAAHASVTVHAFPSEELALKALDAGTIALFVGGSPNPGLARKYGVSYLRPVFYDSQGLLVHKDRGIHALRDLAGKHVCFIGTTEAERHLNDATHAEGISVAPFPFEEIGEMEAALVGGSCDAETHDVSKLASGRAAFHGRVHDFEILPDMLSLDPLSPVIRTDDADWARVVDWVTATLVEAEIKGVTQANAAQKRTSADTGVQELTGARHGVQWGWSLAADWGELFTRDLGARSALRLERGVNRPWTQGGLLWGLE